MNQIHQFTKKHKCPLIVAGDIFHTWNSPPELINFAIENLKTRYGTYAIPGQHDLPNHRYEDIRRSAYWTLVKSKAVVNLPRRNAFLVSKNLCCHAFPWGSEIYTDPAPFDGINLAVIHDYCWYQGHSFPGASEDKHVHQHAKKLKMYDAAVFGDNHIGFQIETKTGLHILNCGGLMRRNADQSDYTPRIGLLKDDGTIESVHINVMDDECLDDVEVKERDAKMEEAAGVLITMIGGMSSVMADFPETVKRFMESKKVDQTVQNIVYDSLIIGKKS